MTRLEEKRLSSLSLKQGFETLNPRELKELKRLVENKSKEKSPPKRTKTS